LEVNAVTKIVGPGRPNPFTEEERGKILKHFRDKIPFYYPFAYTLFFTGMRPSEALALRWGDIDLKPRAFHFEEPVSRPGIEHQGRRKRT
jgi:integrase